MRPMNDGLVEAEPTLFDHVIVNDDFDRAYEQFMGCIADEIRVLQHNGNGTVQQNGDN